MEKIYKIECPRFYMDTLRRESFLIGGKKRYVLVVRNEKGRIITYRKPEGMTKRQAMDIYKKNNSLRENIFIRTITKVKEIDVLEPISSSSRARYKKQAGGKFQGLARARIGKREFFAVSNKGDNRKELEDEALKNLYGIVSYKVLGVSDEDMGKEYLERMHGNVTKGTRYYVSI